MKRSIYQISAITMSVGVLILAASCTGSAADQGELLFQDPGVAKSSINVYTCATCHEAVAGDAGDAILAGVPLAGVVKRPSFWGGQEVDLLRAVNDCLYYFMYKSDPWTSDDAEARAIYAYLESLPGDSNTEAAAPFTVTYTVNEVPLGEASSGGDLYARACQSCHGEAHTGAGALVKWAPILPEEVLEEHPSDQYTAADVRQVFVEKVRHGAFIGLSGQMPLFSKEKLSDQQLGDLLQYLGVLGS